MTTLPSTSSKLHSKLTTTTTITSITKAYPESTLTTKSSTFSITTNTSTVTTDIKTETTSIEALNNSAPVQGIFNIIFFVQKESFFFTILNQNLQCGALLAGNVNN